MGCGCEVVGGGILSAGEVPGCSEDWSGGRGGCDGAAEGEEGVGKMRIRQGGCHGR